MPCDTVNPKTFVQCVMSTHAASSRAMAVVSVNSAERVNRDGSVVESSAEMSFS